MKIEQQVGGDKPTQDAYVGEPRQLTVDTDNWDLRLHDGVTPGGHLIINRDNGDERWQAKSAELDGINFTPEKRGFLTRLGTGIWRIRVWEWDDRNLTITNPSGYSGNPSIKLNEVITSPHTFTEPLTFSGPVTASGGITGNLVGNTTGLHTGDVIGNVTGDVTGDLQGNTFGVHTGGLDTRGAEVIMDDNTIQLSWINGLADYIFSLSIPMGMIMMWSGAEGTIPTGFALCNGLNGTPDLRDRFIVGAGSLTNPPGTIGGSDTHSHTSTASAESAHTHSLSVDPHVLTEAEMPAHFHSSGICEDHDWATTMNRTPVPAVPPSSHGIDKGGSGGTNEARSSTVGGGGGHSHTGTAGAASSHTHTISNSSASSIPPYYALCYVMRIP